MKLTPLLIFAGGIVSGFIQYAINQNPILTLLTFSIALVVGALFLDVKINDDCSSSGFKFKKEDKVDNTKNVILWDRSTVDLPSISYLQKKKFEAIYFCTPTGEQPDMSFILPASGVKTVNHWEYRTDNEIHLKIYLLLTLYHIYTAYGEDVELHIFTRCPDMIKRFKIHAAGYNLNKIVFITDKEF